MKKRIVITGAGVVSPIGSNFNEFMAGLESGYKGINNIKSFNTEFFPTTFGAEVKDSETIVRPNSGIDRKELFIIKAMEELFDNNNSIQNYSSSNRILNLGTGIDYFALQNYVNSEDSKLGNWKKFCKRSYTIVEKLASKYEINGGFTVNVSACVASTQAMGLSFRILKNCKGKVIITGGFDSMLNHIHYMGFYKLGALSDWHGDPSKACRPFDKHRCGLVIGEGGTVYSLQREEEADSKNILAEIVGYNSTMDAYMITDPDPYAKSLANSALKAIEEADISPNDIDCVHLHETGTIKNALAETKAMELIFSKRFDEIPVFSLKGQIGHLISACGSMEILAVIYSLRKQQVLPTINFDEPDPDVPLRIIKDRPLNMKINYVLKLNSAFGGQNTAFVVKKYES